MLFLIFFFFFVYVMRVYLLQFQKIYTCVRSTSADFYLHPSNFFIGVFAFFRKE